MREISSNLNVFLIGSLHSVGVISNEDSTDVTLASQLNKDFLKKRDNEDDDEVRHAFYPLVDCTALCCAAVFSKSMKADIMTITVA